MFIYMHVHTLCTMQWVCAIIHVSHYVIYMCYYMCVCVGMCVSLCYMYIRICTHVGMHYAMCYNVCVIRACMFVYICVIFVCYESQILYVIVLCISSMFLNICVCTHVASCILCALYTAPEASMLQRVCRSEESCASMAGTNRRSWERTRSFYKLLLYSISLYN